MSNICVEIEPKVSERFCQGCIKDDGIQQEIKVLLVNCSDAELRCLKEEIERDEQIRVIGMARNAHEARNMVIALDPDLIIMDILDPQSGGIGFLKRLNHFYPRPVLLISPMSKMPSELALSAFKSGATDIIDKDNMRLFNDYPSSGDTTLTEKIRQITL